VTLFLSESDVEGLLSPEDAVDAVAASFRRLAAGAVDNAPRRRLRLEEGRLADMAASDLELGYAAVKAYVGFAEGAAFVVALFSVERPELIALIEADHLGRLRTGAASAVAAKHLAREHCDTALVCGCGGQAPAQLRALLRVRRPHRVQAYDEDAGNAVAFAAAASRELGLAVAPAPDLAQAVAASSIVITCTTAHRYFITRDMVRPGTFIAAVGADNENKQEIDPLLMANATVVTDSTDQACAIGDLHHAVLAGTMSREDVHAELGEILTGRKRGRASDQEIIVFDSTGTGLQDVAAAIAVYCRAIMETAGSAFVL
jgi:alanine dehydrogenase